MIAAVLASLAAGHNSLRSDGTGPVWAELRAEPEDPTQDLPPMPGEVAHEPWPASPVEQPAWPAEPFGGHANHTRLQVAYVPDLAQGWHLNGTVAVPDDATGPPVCDDYNQTSFSCKDGYELKCYEDADPVAEVGEKKDIYGQLTTRDDAVDDMVDHHKESCPEHLATRLVEVHGAACPGDTTPICYSPISPIVHTRHKLNATQNATTQNVTPPNMFHNMSEVIESFSRKRHNASSNHTPNVTELTTTAVTTAPSTEPSIKQKVVEGEQWSFVSKDKPPGSETFTAHNGTGRQYIVDGTPDHSDPDRLIARSGVVLASDQRLEGTNQTSWSGDGYWGSDTEDTEDEPAFMRAMFGRFPKPNRTSSSADGLNASSGRPNQTSLSADGLNASS